MDDHGMSGFDVENEKPRSGSSVSSELTHEAALFPAVADQHAAAAPRTFAAGPPKTSTEMSKVTPVPGGAADDDDSPADNPRSGIIATMAPNVGLTANQETTSDRIETVVYSTMLCSTTSAC